MPQVVWTGWGWVAWGLGRVGGTRVKTEAWVERPGSGLAAGTGKVGPAEWVGPAVAEGQ